jgi:hypothetical protein
MYGPNSNNWMQDNHDVWNNSMDLAGIQNGGIIGFKYFGFGGLAQDTKGVKAFEGIKKGDEASLNLNLSSNGKGAFKIHVKLDDPWKGEEVGVVRVSDKFPKGKALVYTVPVPALEGLTGKHAIYLVVEGPEVQQPEQPRGQWGRRPQQPQRPEGLFDLHGLGFAKKGKGAVPPMIPQMTIKVDGQQLNIPQTPVMSTNANGYTECNHYQLYGPLKTDSKIEATSNVVKGVKIEVSPVVGGRATVTATYKGMKKYFLIN